MPRTATYKPTTLAPDDPTEYRTAGWIRNRLGVPETRLLRMVARRLVRSYAPAKRVPTYCIDDVLAHQEQEYALEVQAQAARNARAYATRKAAETTAKK
jgi:hypothetical protein